MEDKLIKEHFPELNEPALIEEISRNGKLIKVEPGDKLMEIGAYIKTMPLLIQGSIRIMREDDQGNELFLYYLQPGETCAMSLTCCLTNEKSGIRAIADDYSELILLPVHFMDVWMIRYPTWKAFVMNTYRKRFEELLHTVDSVAFQRMDERLWNFLLDKSTALNTHLLETTHQEIATQLNSTREVISRLLKQLEKQGKIQLSRNKIFLKLK